jgi:hypothetical protein
MSPAHHRYRFPIVPRMSALCALRVSAFSYPIDLQLLVHHQLTNPSSSNSFLFSSIQNARVSPILQQDSPARRVPAKHNSNLFTLLQPLSRSRTAPVLCFQQLARSFAKTPGWGRTHDESGTVDR